MNVVSGSLYVHTCTKIPRELVGMPAPFLIMPSAQGLVARFPQHKSCLGEVLPHDLSAPMAGGGQGRSLPSCPLATSLPSLSLLPTLVIPLLSLVMPSPDTFPFCCAWMCSSPPHCCPLLRHLSPFLSPFLLLCPLHVQLPSSPAGTLLPVHLPLSLAHHLTSVSGM